MANKRTSLLRSLLGFGEARKAGEDLSKRKSRIDKAVDQAVSGTKKKKKKTNK